MSPLDEPYSFHGASAMEFIEWLIPLSLSTLPMYQVINWCEAMVVGVHSPDHR